MIFAVYSLPFIGCCLAAGGWRLAAGGLQMKRLYSQKGVILPLASISFLGILAMIGLAIDTGYTFFQYRKAQTAADAGALGGAFEIFYGNGHGSAVAAALTETSN